MKKAECTFIWIPQSVLSSNSIQVLGFFESSSFNEEDGGASFQPNLYGILQDLPCIKHEQEYLQ